MAKGGGGGNNAMVQLQMQQAAEARAKEELRKQRIEKGLKSINRLFEGSPVMATRQTRIDFSKFNPNAVAPQLAPGTVSSVAQTPDWGLPKGLSYKTSKDAKGVTTHQILDSKGKVIGQDKDLNKLMKSGLMYDERYDTGKKSGGIGASFYDKYRSSMEKFYYPELKSQFDKAKAKATYAHADAGTLASGMAADTAAELAAQDVINRGQAKSQIEDSVGQVRRQVASDKSALVNQLYATEDPTMASNEALAKVRTINMQSPPLSPIGDLFKTLAIGGGAFMQAYGDPYNKLSYTTPGGAVSSGRVIQT